ncbi:MAG: Uma2 family endonuclease [Acetobacteraceae bacterium]
MNVALRKPMTLQQFLAWEDQQDLRYEFDSFQPRAMTGGTDAHSAIQANLIAALNVRLRGKRCRVRGSDLKIHVAGRIRYPDAFVFCTPVPPKTKVVTDPVIVFEVLSDSTASEDLVVKNAEYRATPSVRRYVVLQQDSAAAIVFSHKGEDWVTELVSGNEAVLSLPEIDLEIRLADIYADVEFERKPEVVAEAADGSSPGSQ